MMAVRKEKRERQEGKTDINSGFFYGFNKISQAFKDLTFENGLA